MVFLPPSGGVFRLSHLGVIAGYPMQTVMRFSRCGARFGNKKSPHNNLNLTIPSGMALVRVRYVAIRKLKTCSGSFGSRAGTLSKYVILNCWSRLPQKSSCVNVNLSGQGPSILLRKTVLSLKSPTGAFIAPLRKRELLKTRHFRQLARKRKGNFGKKREGWTVPALLTSFLNQKQVIVPCSQTVSASVQTFRHPRSERFAATANSNGDSARASIRYVEHLMHL